MPWQDGRHELREAISDLTPGVTIAILFLLTVAVVGMFAPWVAPYGEGEILTNESFEGPSAAMWLGSMGGLLSHFYGRLLRPQQPAGTSPVRRV